MSMRDDAVSLKDMLDHAREAVALLRDTNRESFRDQRVLQLSLPRLVEVVGEAATRLSGTTRQAHLDVPWPQIVGMRNRLIHGYDVIDCDLLWDTVTGDLPELITELERIVDEK